MRSRLVLQRRQAIADVVVQRRLRRLGQDVLVDLGGLLLVALLYIDARLVRQRAVAVKGRALVLVGRKGRVELAAPLGAEAEPLLGQSDERAVLGLLIQEALVGRLGVVIAALVEEDAG